MKRFIAIFSFTMYIVLFAAYYFNYANQQFNNITNSTLSFSYKFVIPDDPYNLNAENMELLKQAALKNGVNISRSISYYDSEKNKSLFEDYIFLSNTPTSFFTNIKLSNGRGLAQDDMNNENLFLSTVETNEDNQIGKIKDFGGSHYYSVFTIDKLLARYRYAATYNAECFSDEQFENFINDYVNLLNTTKHNIDHIYTADTYKIVDGRDPRISNIKPSHDQNIIIFQFFFFVVSLFTLIYYLIYHTKEISIMKLNGYKPLSICGHLFLKFYSSIFIISNLIIAICMVFIPDNNSEFFIKVITANIMTFVVLMLALTLISSIYIHSIKMTYCIKGKKPIGIITLFNAIIKLTASIAIILTATNLITNLHTITAKQKALSSWGLAANYGVFYPVTVGNDKDEIISGKYPLDIPCYELYPYLNREMNAIFINADLYTMDSLIANKDNNIVKSIKVNPNYLNTFPVYDENGQQIIINEDIPQTIYLVPEQYRDKEEYNYKYFSPIRKEFHDKLHVDYYHQSPKDESKNIIFIYTKSDQQIFSFNMNVSPYNNNLITDPIIQVMTEANSLVPDRYYATSDNQTIFIKLINSDTEQTYAKLVEKLKEYKIDDNLSHLVKPNELVMKEINSLKMAANLIKIILIGIVIVMFILIIQNVYLFFQKNTYEYFIKKAFGYNYFERYSHILQLLILTNLVEFILCVLLVKRNFYYIFGLKFIIESIILNLFIIYFEKRNMSQILKGGV